MYWQGAKFTARILAEREVGKETAYAFQYYGLESYGIAVARDYNTAQNLKNAYSSNRAFKYGVEIQLGRKRHNSPVEIIYCEPLPPINRKENHTL